MHIELQFGYTVDDIVSYRNSFAGIAKALSPEPQRRARLARILLGWGLILAAAILLFVVFHDEKPAPAPGPASQPAGHPWYMPLLPYGIIFLLIWFVLLPWLRKKSIVKDLFKSDPTMSQPRRVVISEEGVLVEFPTNTTVTKWTHFIHFAETPELMLLVINRQMAFVLPKRVFASEDQINELRSFAQAHAATMKGYPIEVNSTATTQT
jgi:hypothetical protein